MENQKLLKENKKLEKNDEKEIDLKYQKKFSFYKFILMKYIHQYYIFIIIISIIFLIIYKFYYKKSDINNDIYDENNDKKIIKEKSNINKNTNYIIENEKNKNNLIINKSEDIFEEEDLDKKEKDFIDINNNMTDIIKKVNEYILNCQNDILTEGIKQSSNYPKITALTALYNSENTIKATIRSIQNQKMADIEILIIDDFSTDNSLKIIEDLQKEDKRIRIIRNKENNGPLYSKSIGALSAKGKYIMQLDSDDLFINENIFDICYNEAEKNNIDILEFSGFRSKQKFLNLTKSPRIPRYLRYKKNNTIVNQPKLSSFIYKKRINKVIRLIDGYLWGKCIKTDIYKKALDVLGEKLYKQKIYYGDDRIVNFVLFRVANSFKFIKEYGIIYYSTPHSILNSSNKIRNCHDELINIMNIYNLTKDSYDYIFAIFELNKRWDKLISPGLNEENKNLAKNLIQEIKLCKYISKKNNKKMEKYLKYLNKSIFFHYIWKLNLMLLFVLVYF